MRRSLLILGLGLSLPVYCFAQRGSAGYNGANGNGQPVQVVEEMSTLSVFSENGEPFYLIVNGVRQNLAPQSKIRVESLPQYVSDVQIVFANNRIAPIRKKIIVSDPVDGKAVSLTLRISTGRGGARLQFYRMTGCEHNYRGPRDEYVMYYGDPQQINAESTYTDPVTGNIISDNYATGYINPPPAPPLKPTAMSAATFNDVKNSISSVSFEDTKLSTAKTILNTNYVTTDQVIEICKIFSFENTRLSFAKFAYGRTVDPQNYFKVASVLDFDSNKKTLNRFITANLR